MPKAKRPTQDSLARVEGAPISGPALVPLSPASLAVAEPRDAPLSARAQGAPRSSRAPEAPPSARMLRPLSRTEGILELIAFVAKQMPLSALLDGVPHRIGHLFDAEIVSIYLLEGEGDGLVLRGNVGFRPEARGVIRLRVGEGLTGLAVKTMRPVVVVRAPRHDAFRRFDELEEDRYPVFLAVPIPGPDHKPLGALVVQRKQKAFDESEVHLAMALTAPVASAVRNAALLDDLRDKVQRKTGGGTRKLMLPGLPVVAGRALGAVAALRRPAKDRQSSTGAHDAARIENGFDQVRRELASLASRAQRAGVGSQAGFLETYALMAEDGRLRERAVELVKGGASVAVAISNVAREATRHARGIVGDPFMEQRSADMEDLCDIVSMLAAPDLRATVPSKAVLLGDRITVFDVMVTARSSPAGIALTTAGDPRTRVLLQILGIPAIVDVAMAFRWASPGDIALLDADHGFLVVNPSRAEVANLRASRRAGSPSGRGSSDSTPTPPPTGVDDVDTSG